MYQTILVSAMVPSGGYNLDILSVDKVANMLVVVSRIRNTLKPGMMTIAACCNLTEKVVIENGSDKPLKVVNYLTDVPKSDEGKHPDLIQDNRNTQFISISDVSEISELLTGSVRLHTYQKKHKRQSRLADYDTQKQAQQLPVMLAGAIPSRLLVDDVKLDSIVNIHPAVTKDGVFKVVFEYITAKSAPRSYYDHEISMNTHQNLSYFCGGRLHFDMDLCQMVDSAYEFKTMHKGQPAWFTTSAVEYCLQGQLKFDELSVIMEAFDRWVAQMIAAGKKEARDFRYIQFSEHSVLDYFKDHLVTELEKGSTSLISNAMPICLETFIAAPGTYKVNERVSEYIMKALANRCAKLPGYKTTVSGLQNYLGVTDSIEDPIQRMDSTFSLPVSKLFTDIPQEEKLKIVEQLEAKLYKAFAEKAGPGGSSAPGTDYSAQRFALHSLLKLIEPALGKIAYDDGQYKFTYTEITSLLSGHFVLHSDGRMRFAHGIGYEVHYAPGRRLHKVCAAEFGFLAKVLGLSFAEDNNFHASMVFTPESTLKLRALGVHLNTLNFLAITYRQAPEVNPMLTQAGLGLFAGTAAPIKPPVAEAPANSPRP